MDEAAIQRRWRAPPSSRRFDWRQARRRLPLAVALALPGIGLARPAYGQPIPIAQSSAPQVTQGPAGASNPPSVGSPVPGPPTAAPTSAPDLGQRGNSDREQHAAGVLEYIAAPPPAGGQLINLRTNLFEPADLPYPISLATALQLADARPLVVAAAQASAWVAEAQYQRARLIKVPELDFGVCYVRHDGYGPDFNHGVKEPTFTPGVGGPLNQNLNFMYAGGSFFMQVPLTDAIFQPLVARQVLNGRRMDIQAAKNDALLMTARAYFKVHQYRGQYAGARDVVERGRLLVARIEQLSRDLVPRVEVERADRMLADIEQHAALARQEWRVSSANLTQVIRLDPRVMVEPLEARPLASHVDRAGAAAR